MDSPPYKEKFTMAETRQSNQAWPTPQSKRIRPIGIRLRAMPNCFHDQWRFFLSCGFWSTANTRNRLTTIRINLLALYRIRGGISIPPPPQKSPVKFSHFHTKKSLPTNSQQTQWQSSRTHAGHTRAKTNKKSEATKRQNPHNGFPHKNLKN